MAEKDIEFGKRLQQAIVGAGLNKLKAAKAIDASPSAFTSYINEGRIPEAPILFKLSQLLNKPMDWFLTGKEPIKKGLNNQTEEAPIEVKSSMEQGLLETFRELSSDGKVLIAAEAVKRKEQEEQQRDLRKKENAALLVSGERHPKKQKI